MACRSFYDERHSRSGLRASAQTALDCFLADEYHKVTTRAIADQAGVNISMIRYYFGNKEGLYEEMIRETLKPLLDMLVSETLSEAGGFADYLRLYYDTMRRHPEFPKLILKVRGGWNS